MAEGDERAKAIYETIGVYFGYTIAYYCEFYDINQVLIMGRVTSGEGGEILLARAKEVLATEFPELNEKITLNIPDEKARRVGQSVAAASLPKIVKESNSVRLQWITTQFNSVLRRSLREFVAKVNS